MIVIEIDSLAVATREGIKDGKNWRMHFQQAAVHGHYVEGFPARNPRDMALNLDEKNPVPFPVGKYVISAEAFYFGDFGRLSLGRMKLQTLAAFVGEIQKQLPSLKVAA